MLFDKHVNDRSQAIALANRLGVVVMLLILALLFVGYHAITKKNIVQLIPPYLDERVSVAYNEASKEYKIKYALYSAVLMGNANPESVEHIIDALSVTFSPELYNAQRSELMLQAKELQKSSTAIEFRPVSWEYESETDLVFITGKQILRPSNGEAKSKVITYEFQLEFNSYAPTITHFALYSGNARTFEYRQANAGTSTGS